MTKNYDNKELLEILLIHLDKNSTLLELGIGSGKDLDVLKDIYMTCGSDSSKVFLDTYKDKNPEADIVQLDAITINIDRKFDCIYSNKILQHLTKDELITSIKNQSKILNINGLIFHTFWYGEETEEYDGLLFNYYKEDELKTIFNKYFKIIDICKYKEENDNDSIYIIGKKF